MICQKRIEIKWRQKETGFRYGLFYLDVFDLSVTEKRTVRWCTVHIIRLFLKRTYTLLYASLNERVIS